METPNFFYFSITATGQNRFKSRTSNVLPVVTVSGGEPAVALVSPAGSSAPPQPATEPDTSSANTKSRPFENGKKFYCETRTENLFAGFSLEKSALVFPYIISYSNK